MLKLAWHLRIEISAPLSFLYKPQVLKDREDEMAQYILKICMEKEKQEVIKKKCSLEQSTNEFLS